MKAAKVLDYRDVLRVTSPFPPINEPKTQKSVALTEKEWDRVGAIAKTTRNTSSEVVRHFVQWSLQELDRVAEGELHPEAKRVLELLADEGHAGIAEKVRAKLTAELKKGNRR